MFQLMIFTNNIKLKINQFYANFIDFLYFFLIFSGIYACQIANLKYLHPTLHNHRELNAETFSIENRSFPITPATASNMSLFWLPQLHPLHPLHASSDLFFDAIQRQYLPANYSIKSLNNNVSDIAAKSTAPIEEPQSSSHTPSRSPALA